MARVDRELANTRCARRGNNAHWPQSKSAIWPLRKLVNLPLGQQRARWRVGPETGHKRHRVILSTSHRPNRATTNAETIRMASTHDTPVSGEPIADNGPGWDALVKRHLTFTHGDHARVELDRLRFCRANPRRASADKSAETHLLNEYCWRLWQDIDKGRFGHAAVSTAEDLCIAFGKGDRHTCATEIATAVMTPDPVDGPLRSLKAEHNDVMAAAYRCGMSAASINKPDAVKKLIIARANGVHDTKTTSFGRMLAHDRSSYHTTPFYNAAKEAGVDDATAMCMASVLGQRGPIIQ